jgi:glycosyltransferase involved in cell wall biosynthesis
MRIAMIGGRGLPARLGGVERVVEDLARELSAEGHEVLVYSRRGYAGRTEAPRFARRIFTAGLAGKHLDTITHTATAVWDVLRRKADVVHVHNPGPALCSWLPRLAGRPVVLTVHAPDWRREKWSLPARAALQAGLAVGMRVADAVTAVSRSLADELAGRFGRAVTFVPNGVRPPEKTNLALPDRPNKWSLSPEGYALHVGRLVPEKRLHELLDAWGRARLDIPLVVAGEGEKGYAASCRRMAPPGVRFVGSVYGEELVALYAGARMVIQPSVLEGASLVLLEAASHGRCVLSTDMPANREILGDAGLYFTKENPAALAERIIRCNKDSALRRDIGRRAQDHVAKTFPTGRVAREMLDVYREVLRKDA